MTKYYLKANIYACNVDNHCVFLDLNNDKYSCLEPEQSRLLPLLLAGKNSPEHNAAMSELVSQLIANDLITKNANEGKNLQNPKFERPQKDLIGYDVNKRPKIKARHIWNFFGATLVSSLRLRWQPLEKIVVCVQKRKQRHDKKTIKPVDHAKLKELTEVFNRLRPLLFTAQNQCLYDALVMINFLAAYHIYPHWIFGVKMGPFAAHCWVQYGDVVINDSVAMTLLQTPIMVV